MQTKKNKTNWQEYLEDVYSKNILLTPLNSVGAPSGEDILNFILFSEDSTNAYLNENWRPVSESLRPILSKTIEDILLGFMQQLFHNLPGNFMIGDIKSNLLTKRTDKKVW